MDGIWIRTEDGKVLTHAVRVWVQNGAPVQLLATDDGIIEVLAAKFNSEEAAIRQLDDIQKCLEDGVSGTVDGTHLNNILCMNIYDLRERKVKEDD
jgi:hypothetical protein